MKTFLTITAAVLSAVTAFAAGEVRVDLFGSKIELRDIAAKAPLTAHRFKHYKGKPMEMMSAMFLSQPLTEKWQEFELSFMPEKDGQVSILFHVPGSKNKANIRPVLVDDVKTTGATLENGGFELLKQDGKVSGWNLRKLAEFITGEDAAEGKSCIKVSFSDGAAAQVIKVKGGEKVVVTFKAKLAKQK